jgi:hypothetical protein
MRTTIKIRKKNLVPSSPEILAVDALVRVLVHAAPRLVLLLYGTVRDQFRPSRTYVRTRMRNHVRALRNPVRGIADLVYARGNPARSVGGGVRTQGTVDQQGHHLTMVCGQMVGGQMVGGQMVGGQMVGGQMVGGQMIGGQMGLRSNVWGSNWRGGGGGCHASYYRCAVISGGYKEMSSILADQLAPSYRSPIAGGGGLRGLSQ